MQGVASWLERDASCIAPEARSHVGSQDSRNNSNLGTIDERLLVFCGDGDFIAL
jgi:hypothetical protein